jgi:ABC-2 type transport system ATP-binding protein
MLKADKLTKLFDNILAVDNVTAEVKEGNVFGLIGSNGAGKSTFLRMAAGILKADSGSITIDEREIYENVDVKSRVFYISDEQYFFANSTPDDIRSYYNTIYSGFDNVRFFSLLDSFGLSKSRKINTFSKGMKKQLSVICGVSSRADYLLCDETFDGLDPVARQAVKSLFAADVAERGMTPIIASHNLRELEDICDHVGLLHRGGILFSKDIEDMKLNIQKIQVVFKEEFPESLNNELNILSIDRRGSMYTLIVRGSREDILVRVEGYAPIFFELLPLTLEEIFITETEVAGYDIKKLIL